MIKITILIKFFIIIITQIIMSKTHPFFNLILIWLKNLHYIKNFNKPIKTLILSLILTITILKKKIIRIIKVRSKTSTRNNIITISRMKMILKVIKIIVVLNFIKMTFEFYIKKY